MKRLSIIIVVTAENVFKDYESKQNESEYTQEQLIDASKLIEKIKNTINVIIETLNKIEFDEHDYETVMDGIIKLPIVISQCVHQIQTQCIHYITNRINGITTFCIRKYQYTK